MNNSQNLQYNEQINKHLTYINQVKLAFEKQCEKLKNTAEIAISKIPVTSIDKKDQEIKIKVELKKNLDKTLEEFGKVLKDSFGNNLILLERIYREKENLRLKEIESLFTKT